QSGTQGALTGVGLSIGYPTGNDGALSGLMKQWTFMMQQNACRAPKELKYS
nr:carboxyl-terminal-processing peptidase 2, chloroplastic [Tanacetum cinerariifolium]